MICIIGDSHSLTFSSVPSIRVSWMSALTAHNLFKKDIILDELFSKPCDDYWFLFGEIDCRIHFYFRACTQDKNPEDLIDTTVDQYLTAIKKYRELDFSVSVMAIPPQGIQNNYYNLSHYAPREIRQQYTDWFNNKLKTKAEECNISFHNVYESLNVSSSKLLPEKYLMDDFCHLKHNLASELLKQYLEEHCLK